VSEPVEVTSLNSPAEADGIVWREFAPAPTAEHVLTVDGPLLGKCGGLEIDLNPLGFGKIRVDGKSPGRVRKLTLVCEVGKPAVVTLEMYTVPAPT